MKLYNDDQLRKMSADQLRAAYVDVRSLHNETMVPELLAEIRQLKNNAGKSDRAMLLRVAGSVAAAFAAPGMGDGLDYVNEKREAAIAARAVRLARAILAEIDRKEPTP